MLWPRGGFWDPFGYFWGPSCDTFGSRSGAYWRLSGAAWPLITGFWGGRWPQELPKKAPRATKSSPRDPKRPQEAHERPPKDTQKLPKATRNAARSPRKQRTQRKRRNLKNDGPVDENRWFCEFETCKNYKKCTANGPRSLATDIRHCNPAAERKTKPKTTPRTNQNDPKRLRK